jgi:transcriptional regulator with XRE-family HTH domain
MNYKQQLQEAILERMKLKGVTQISLAKELNVSKQAVQIFLKTDNVGYEKLFELAGMVGLAVEIRTYVL